MSTLPLDAILATCARYAPAATQQATAVLEQPWQIVLVGRIGVGKTTLFNRITGRADPTGLGGLTLRPQEASAGGCNWIDTPGMDGRDTALATLGPIVDQADGVIWVIDALQPATRTERDVMALVCPADLVISVVIARWDLVPKTERKGVRARVKRLCPTAVDIHTCNLRQNRPDVAAATSRATSPRRALAVGLAVQAALSAHASQDPPPDPAAAATLLRSSWSRAVREAAAATQVLVDQDIVESQAGLTSALGSHHRQVASSASNVDALFRAFEADGSVRWPLPPQATSRPMARVAAAMGGRLRASELLKELTARWMMEGHLVATEWAEGSPHIAATRATWQADIERLRPWLNDWLLRP
jgi:small GTP-binding protein